MTNLLTYENAKTSKGEELGVLTAILYLAPSDLSGVDLCPKASEGCRAACLFTAGRGAFKNVFDARMRKTKMFLQEKNVFALELHNEIERAKKKAKRLGLMLAVRLNGTSDVLWERVKVGSSNVSLMELHSDVQFYDYTKIAARFKKPLPKNYHLTFSRSESNESEALQVLQSGYNVAMVFDVKRGHDLPARYMGFEVIDGDLHDIRFIDRPGVIVGLRAKGKARKDSSGFVISCGEERVA